MIRTTQLRHILAALTLALLLAVPTAHTMAQRNVALKTNLLYWGTTTPNVGIEASVGKKHTVQLFYGLNPWNKFLGESNKSLKHWLVMPEYRYWFCQSFNGWFVGAHLMGGQFNAGGIKLPLGMFPEFRDHHYEGWGIGGGITAGYQWPLSKHWNFEASMGVGYDYLKYDKYKCGECGEKIKSSHSNYWGPTKTALSLLYIF